MQIPKLFMSAPHLNSLATGWGAEEAATAADAMICDLCLAAFFELAASLSLLQCFPDSLKLGGALDSTLWLCTLRAGKWCENGLALEASCSPAIGQDIAASGLRSPECDLFLHSAEKAI